MPPITGALHGGADQGIGGRERRKPAARQAGRSLERRHRVPQHFGPARRAHQARAANAATAGSSLPSRNSRNAPPPVEM